MRAQRSARPGWYSKTRFSIPSSSKIFLKNVAARNSFPGGFEVSIRRYSCIHSTARSEYRLSRSGGMRDDGSDKLADADEAGALGGGAANEKANTILTTASARVGLRHLPAPTAHFFIPPPDMVPSVHTPKFLYQHLPNLP